MPIRLLTIGSAAFAAWFVLWWGFLRETIGLVGFAIPAVLGAVALVLSLWIVALRSELRMLQDEMQRMKRQFARDAAARTAHTPPRETARQAPLPLDAPPDARGDQDLTVHDLLCALDFPRDADDRQGLQILNRARAHGRIAPVIQAAQDLMTLLGDDGIYADDLNLSHADASAWRACADGERSHAAEPLGVPDDASLHQVLSRLGRDPVFHDTAHHFMRRMDDLLIDIASQTDDATLVAFGGTRSGKCFRLIGTALGAFASQAPSQPRASSGQPDGLPPVSREGQVG